MSEMLTSALMVSAPNVNAVSSSDAGRRLTSPLSHWSTKNAVHFILDEDDSRTGQGHPQHSLVALRRLALYLLGRGKGANPACLPNVIEPAGKLTVFRDLLPEETRMPCLSLPFG